MKGRKVKSNPISLASRRINHCRPKPKKGVVLLFTHYLLAIDGLKNELQTWCRGSHIFAGPHSIDVSYGVRTYEVN